MEDKRFKVSTDNVVWTQTERTVISTIIDTYTGVNYLKVTTQDEGHYSNGVCVIPLIDADGKPYVSEDIRTAYLERQDAIRFVKDNIEFLEKDDVEGLYDKYPGNREVLIELIKNL